MQTFEDKIRFHAENSATRREFDAHIENIIDDIILLGGCEVVNEGKVFREDAVSFRLWTNSLRVGNELSSLIEQPKIYRYFCFDGESEDTVEAPTVEDFREIVEREVKEFAFDLF